MIETVSWSDHDLQQATNTQVSLGPHGDQAEGEDKTLLVLLVSGGCRMSNMGSYGQNNWNSNSTGHSVCALGLGGVKEKGAA